jgi:hypothetical protein
LVPFLNIPTQNLYYVQADAGFRVNNHLWIDGFVAEQHGDVNVPGFNYWSTIVGLKVRANFGR